MHDQLPDVLPCATVDCADGLGSVRYVVARIVIIRIIVAVILVVAPKDVERTAHRFR